MCRVMTPAIVQRRAIGFASLGILSVLMAAAAASETKVVAETFTQTAERFGLFAAIAVFFTVVSTAGLIWVVRYSITTLQDCVDDNTHANLRLCEILKTRPCIHDSDIDKIRDDSSLGETGARVVARRAARKGKQ